jgi:hypothetical protein
MIIGRAYWSKGIIFHILTGPLMENLGTGLCGADSMSWHDVKKVLPEEIDWSYVCKRCKRKHKPTLPPHDY